MSENKKIGTFVFRNEGDGCLTSKYVDSTYKSPQVEAAKLKKGTSVPNDKFIGKYDTVWIEEPLRHVRAELQISKIEGEDIYRIKWTKEPGTNYEGIGMLYGDVLVGSYWY